MSPSSTSPDREGAPAAEARSEHPFLAAMLDFYALTAAQHDAWDAGVHAKAAEACVEIAAIGRSDRVLDVGCGTGLVAHAAADVALEGSVVAVDVSPHMLEVAQQHNRHAVSLLQMDARDLCLQDAAFDVVVMCQVLALQSNPRQVLGEASRVLRAGGRLVVCCQQRSLATEAEQLFFRQLDAVAARGVRIPRPPSHNALFGEPWVLQRLLRDAGFMPLRTTNLVVGNHTENAAAWIELERGAGPYPHALISILGPAMRAQLEAALDLTMRSDLEGAFRYHRAFTFAVAQRA